MESRNKTIIKWLEDAIIRMDWVNAVENGELIKKVIEKIPKKSKFVADILSLMGVGFALGNMTVSGSVIIRITDARIKYVICFPDGTFSFRTGERKQVPSIVALTELNDKSTSKVPVSLFKSFTDNR